MTKEYDITDVEFTGIKVYDLIQLMDMLSDTILRIDSERISYEKR